MRSRRIRSLSLVLLAALAACGGAATSGAGAAPPSGPAPMPAAQGPAEVVERFLRLSASHSYLQMGQLFGTVEGPITQRDPGPQVERRMYAIANILQNERFVIRGQQAIPGRGPDALQLAVQITQQGQVKEVPFVVVRAGNGAWLVEQVDLQALTRVQ